MESGATVDCFEINLQARNLDCLKIFINSITKLHFTLDTFSLIGIHAAFVDS